MREINKQNRIFWVSDDQPTFWDRFESGTWEPETLDLLDRLLLPQSLFVDIGAWVGPTALWGAFSAQRVLALEADPRALDQLARNLAVNPSLAARIEIIPRALHQDAGKIAMGAKRKPGDSMSSVLLASTGNKAVWQAETITPSGLAPLLNEDDIVVKMDIEGGEYALLPHMTPIIAKARAVLISFHHELARNVFGWSTDEVERTEDNLFELFAGFERQAVGPMKADSASVEWAFIRK